MARTVPVLRAHHEPPTVFPYLRAAELCYVSSLHNQIGARRKLNGPFRDLPRVGR